MIQLSKSMFTRMATRFSTDPFCEANNLPIELTIWVLSLRFEVALMHNPYTIEFMNRKLTN